MASTPSHVRTELIEVAEADCKLLVICMDHLTSSAVNIIDEEMGLALAKAVMEAEWYVENELINGVVLCSGKHQSFLAGADILFEQKITSKARLEQLMIKLHANIYTHPLIAGPFLLCTPLVVLSASWSPWMYQLLLLSTEQHWVEGWN